MWLRTASETDLQAISDLLVAAWHHTYDGIYGVDKVDTILRDWHSVKVLRQRLNKPQSEFFLADDGADLGGMAYAAMQGDTIAQLHQLYVHPEFQDRGVGKMLLVEAECNFPLAQKMRLEVEEANDKAKAFYERNGYSQIGRTENCGRPDSGIPALIFEKTL
jgi:ribosomal protein S18 acetylase RimI-like enzyme